METNQLTEEQLKVAFCEVRKAHRLIYEYQRRMQDLSWFIRNKLGYNNYQGFKKFSNTLKSSNKIEHDFWSWDWIYSYVYEYFLGEQTNKKNENSWRLSIIQISDDGFYKKKDSVATNLKTFATVEESQSKLLFYLSVATKNANYDWDPSGIIKKYADKEGGYTIKNDTKTQIVFSVSMTKFVNEEATMQILRDFVKYCNDNAGTDLKIQE